MKTIWKYPLALQDGAQEIAIPSEAHILCVADQHGFPTLWIEVNPESPRTLRAFQIHGTGHPINSNGTYLGSAIGSRFGWHVYEIPNYHNN